jgi:hypothetical protein
MPRLVPRDLRGFSFEDRIPLAANGKRWVQDDRVARHEHIEKMPDCRKVLLSRCDPASVLIEVPPDEHRRDLGQQDPLLRAPYKEGGDRVSVRSAGVGIAEPAEEELVPREAGGCTRGRNDHRDRLRRIVNWPECEGITRRRFASPVKRRSIFIVEPVIGNEI